MSGSPVQPLRLKTDMVAALETELGTLSSLYIWSSTCTTHTSPLPPTAPCAPTTLDVRARMIGRTYWLMVSWESVNCSAVEYLVEVHGRIQDSPQALMQVSSYWADATYFELPMPCSTAYNLTVRSRNSAGLSEPSNAYSGVTGSHTFWFYDDDVTCQIFRNNI